MLRVQHPFQSDFATNPVDIKSGSTMVLVYIENEELYVSNLGRIKVIRRERFLIFVLLSACLIDYFSR